mgnify:CR=1 FL=1
MKIGVMADSHDRVPAIADLLGPEVTAFLLGESRTAPVDQLLAAVEPPGGTWLPTGPSAP